METEGGYRGVWQLCGGSNPRHRRPVLGGGGDGEREMGEGERGERIPVIALCVIVVKINHIREDV
jgi:hypothetical protein